MDNIDYFGSYIQPVQWFGQFHTARALVGRAEIQSVRRQREVQWLGVGLGECFLRPFRTGISGNRLAVAL